MLYFQNTTIFNPPDVGVSYAVFSSSTPTMKDINTNSYRYVFYLPLTALSWKRLGIFH